MKTLLFACFLLGLLAAVARPDILGRGALPPQTLIMVTNLKAFPEFKFSYDEGDGTPRPLEEMQSLIGNFYAARLFVEDRSGERFEWASVPHTVTATEFSILDVHREGKEIKVSYKMLNALASEGKPTPKSSSSAVLITLSVLSLGAVLLAMRRKRRVSAGG